MSYAVGSSATQSAHNLAATASTTTAETATNPNNNSILDTSSQNGLSEYTVNTTVTTN